MNRLNQQKLIALRMSRGLAVRQLARDCGIEISVLNRLETSTEPSLTTISLAAFTRLADRLGVEIGALFTDNRNHTDLDHHTVAPGQDAEILGALLTSLMHDTSIVALADSLGWTTDEVHTTAAALDRTLQSAGMTVYKNSGLMSIRPANQTHADAELAVRRHPRARGKQRLTTPGRAKIIHRATTQAISPHSLSETDRIHIAVLVKAGVLIEDDNRHFVPSADVLDSLYPDEAGAQNRCASGHNATTLSG